MKRLVAGPASLRRRVFVGAVLSALVLVVAVGVIINLSSTMRGELGKATDAFIEEQAIADGLLRAVTRQLVAASLFATQDSRELVTEFQAAGNDAYNQIRRYLSRPLTSVQRLQLEAVKEQHERLEVAASEAFALFQHGHAPAAHRSAATMIEHSLSLQRELDLFLAMRQRDVIMLRERQASTFRYLYWSAAALVGLLFLGFAILASFLNRRISSPLGKLIDATARVASGDLRARVTSRHDDEFAVVANSFNRMTERLEHGQSEIEDRNTQLQAAVDALQTMQQELIQTEKLSAMGRMMAGLAHELNNPLASVLGYAELLDAQLTQASGPGQPACDELRADLVAPLVEQAQRARGLVRDFLQFSRQDAAGLKGVLLRDPLDVITRLRAYTFRQSGLDILIDDDLEACVSAQPQRLEQVFLNLTNNAFDAMKDQGHGALRIRTTQSRNFVTVRFEDDGPGFAQHDRVFEPFYTTKPVGAGTGLGLTLVHEFMEEFGGSATAENRQDGGARIILRFRRTDLDCEANEPAAASAITPAATTMPRILVVEDERPLQVVQKRILARIGAEVLLAGDVEEAKRIVAQTELDLIISDVRMPGGQSGVDLFRWIQIEHPHLAARFLLVTGDVTDAEVAEIARDHDDRVIHKPFMMHEYLACVNRILNDVESTQPAVH